jgi:hypothetical protein
MNTQLWIAGIAVLITFSTFLANVIFRSGHVTGALEMRVTALENWRSTMRVDMHEVSEKIEAASVKMEVALVELRAVHQLIDERTDRRRLERPTCPLHENCPLDHPPTVP